MIAAPGSPVSPEHPGMGSPVPIACFVVLGALAPVLHKGQVVMQGATATLAADPALAIWLGV